MAKTQIQADALVDAVHFSIAYDSTNEYGDKRRRFLSFLLEPEEATGLACALAGAVQAVGSPPSCPAPYEQTASERVTDAED